VAVLPAGTTGARVELALAAACAVRPETSKERMHTRLTARAAELEGTPARVDLQPERLRP